MSQLISSFPIGTIYYQSGKGYPTHIATRGCTYIDTLTAIEYINKDGLVDWVPFSDSSSSIFGNYLPLSGGTVYGPTSFTSGLTSNTLNVSGLTQTSGITSTGGITFKQVTINSSYTATTSDYMIDVTGGTFNVTLPSAVGIQGRLLVVKNNGGGAVTVQPVLGQNIDDKPFVVLGETNSIQLASNGSNWVAMSYNISTVNSSTGVFEFTGLTIASTTTFNVAPIKGWIVDDTTNPLSPQLYYVAYSGGVHTAIYVNTSTETWVYLTSGGTISQSSIELTEQQRRQNIFLGKLGHANKTNIINAFSQPDFVLSPLSQLRDMFTPINLINGGIYASPNGANLSFNTSAGYLYGLGINFASNTLAPNELYVSGTNPCTFQYRTQTGGTASNTTFIDPTKYDVGGVITSITGTKATNQRIYLVQNGIFRVQYGQTEYNQLSAAIEGIATEQFNTFSNFTNNGILIGVLSVLSTATNLSDTSKARFFFTSKFGETVGSAGGVSTTNLQQAYNNSITPEITTNTTLGALSIKNGTGNADNVTRLLEGINAAGNTTSFIRADGDISGTTFQSNSYISTGTYGYTNLNASNNQSMIVFSGSNTVGGAGYIDFIKVTNTAAGATNINKTIRVNNTGGIEFINSTYNATIFTISDNGIITITSPASVTSNSATNNALNVGTKGQLFDDGNFHVHSSSGAVWINALDGSAIRLGTQTNSGNSTVIVDTTTVGHSFFTKVQSGFNVAFGTEITMDNLKVRINGTGGSGGLIQAGAVSGSFAAYTTLVGNVAGAAIQGDTNSGGITFTTTYQNISGVQKTLSAGGDTTTLHLIDTTNSRIYRITAIHCQGTTGGYTSIERMA
jgi:hypothetical protein